MTWAKYGTEFFDQLAEFDFPTEIDDACQLVHTQALHYLYSTEEMEASFLKKNLRRIVSSPKAEQAAQALVMAGAWESVGNRYRVRHHEEVFRQSLGYQVGNREGARNRKRKERSAKKGGGPPGPEREGVTQNVTRDVTPDVLQAQTDRQTALDNQPSTKADTSAGKPTPQPPPSSEDLSSSELGPDGWPLNLGTTSDGGVTDGPSPEALNRWGRSA